MQNLTSQEETQNIFKNIELTAEQYKEEFKKLARDAQRVMDSQMNSSKFEAANDLSLSKEQRVKTLSDVKDVRNELW